MKKKWTLLLLGWASTHATAHTLKVSFQQRTYQLSTHSEFVEFHSENTHEKLSLRRCDSLKGIQYLWQDVTRAVEGKTHFDSPLPGVEPIRFELDGKKGEVHPKSEIAQVLKEIPNRAEAVFRYARIQCKRL